MIKDIVLGHTTKTSLRKQDNVLTVDFTKSTTGRSYTLNISKTITPNDGQDQIFIMFDYDYIIRIFLHDPSFFVYNFNPIGLPTLSLWIDPNKTTNNYHWLTITEVEELDLPEDPCINDLHYNFQASNSRNNSIIFIVKLGVITYYFTSCFNLLPPRHSQSELLNVLNN